MRLLEDGNFTHLKIESRHCAATRLVPQRQVILTWLWVGFTWLCFAALILFCVYAPHTTWVSQATCTIFTGWSVILRLAEHVAFVPASHTDIFHPDKTDAVFILGRDRAGILLEGRREDIKHWTSSGFVYRGMGGLSRGIWQGLTRVGTALVLLLIFAAVPNGSTTDQLAFITLNLLGQINTLVQLRLNAMRCIASWSVETRAQPPDRTSVYAHLIRHFADLDQAWIAKSGILPAAPAWDKWKIDILRPENREVSPKTLYNKIAEELNIAGEKQTDWKVKVEEVRLETRGDFRYVGRPGI
jgi:hypothetical protein